MSTDSLISLNSGLPDVRHLPLDAEVIDSVEYTRIMRRIGVSDGESETPVSAFNSYI